MERSKSEVVVKGLTVEEHLVLHAAWLEGDPYGQQANFSGINLSNVDLTGADLRLSMCNHTNFSGSKMRLSILAGAQAQGACFAKTYLHFANLEGADLTAASFEAADLRNSSMDSAFLFCTYFHNADLRGATMNNSQSYSVDVRGAIMFSDLYSQLNSCYVNMENVSIDGRDLHADGNIAKIA